MTAEVDLDEFNNLGYAEVRDLLVGCLDVPRWVEEVTSGRPYADHAALLATADSAARTLSEDEVASALAGHPRIGERAGAGHNTAASSREQAGVHPADTDLAARLAIGNRAYEERFGRVFLIRAAGRDGGQILAELERRLGNDDATEATEVTANLREIALLRLAGTVDAGIDED